MPLVQYRVSLVSVSGLFSVLMRIIDRVTYLYATCCNSLKTRCNITPYLPITTTPLQRPLSSVPNLWFWRYKIVIDFGI